MGALQSSQAASSYVEKLRSSVPLLYERDDSLLQKMQKNANVEVVGMRSMRISLQIRPGGKAGQVNMDGGDLGRGSGTIRDQALLSPIFFKFGAEVTKLVEYATNQQSKAVENVAKKEVKNAMAQFRAFLDKLLQTDGTGVLANIASTNGATTLLTLGSPFYGQLLYFNQTLQVYDATITTNRGSVTIVKIDPDNQQITVDALPVGTIATDVLLLDGVAGANPVSLFGIKYHQSNASAGTWLNLSRAFYPEIRTPKVTANSAIVTSHVRLAKNKIRKALGINALNNIKLVAYTAMEQAHAWEQLSVTISIENRAEGGGTVPDLLFSKEGTMGGVPIELGLNADPTRIDFLSLANWIRCVIQEVDFYDVGGQTVHPVYGASGGLAAAYLFYYILGMQIANQNPRAGAYVDTLTKPAGY